MDDDDIENICAYFVDSNFFLSNSESILGDFPLVYFSTFFRYKRRISQSVYLVYPCIIKNAFLAS